jgi:hypothetical protein
MSDLSVLSHEYKTASELSQAINRALITLKKVQHGLPGADAIPPEEIETSRRTLAEILGVIAVLLDPVRAEELDNAAALRVPQSLVSRLRAERRGDLAYYLDDLTAAAGRLGERDGELTDEDLALLDQVGAAADTETSGLFRRLMRT